MNTDIPTFARKGVVLDHPLEKDHVLGFFVEYIDMITYKVLGYEYPENEPGPYGSDGRKYVTFEETTILYDWKKKPKTIKASKERPIKALRMVHRMTDKCNFKSRFHGE